MLARTSTLIRSLLLIAASVLIFAVAVDQFPELLLLNENTSNDFTIRNDRFAAQALMLNTANHASVPLNPKGPELDKGNWVRQPPTFEDEKPSSANLLLLSVLRR